ncbi:pectinesterase inhibitor-like [Salvia divinorum]|uniref:Pectinesterase inhibitor-like n=1 Tax=Salvia divinorum TaxID=28513 RepID=A0ABD1G0G2_SALDI
MASFTQKLILITLILAVAIPISTAHRRRWRRRSPSRGRGDDNAEQFLRDICSRHEKADACLSLIKADPRLFDNSDNAGAVSDVIDLALEKTGAFAEQLNKWYEDTNDSSIRERYGSCAESYDDVRDRLEDAKRDVGSDDFRSVGDRADEARDVLERCERVFGPGSIDPGHVENRNNEIRIYLDIVRAATTRLD